MTERQSLQGDYGAKAMSKEPTDVMMIGAYLTLDPAKADYEAVTHGGVKLGEQVRNAMNSLIVISTNGGSTDPSTTPPTSCSCRSRT